MRDIRDVEAFVLAAIHRLDLDLSRADRDDLAQEGFLIMCELERRFTPAHAGRWSFCTYAGAHLPRRLISALHKQQGHVRVRTDEGREWRQPTISFEQAQLARGRVARVRRAGDFARVQIAA